MRRRAMVLWHEIPAGFLAEVEDGFMFQYAEEFLNRVDKQPVSFTLPLQKTPFISKTMFAFFDGLIPEGWLLDVARQTWKLDPRDRMGLLLTCCKDCIGAVSVVPEKDEG